MIFVLLFDVIDICRIRRNATTSPLLKLPGEIRDKILMMVIGDRLIHIQYRWKRPFNQGEIRFPVRDLMYKPTESNRKNSSCYVCSEDITETQIRQESRQGLSIAPKMDTEEQTKEETKEKNKEDTEKDSEVDSEEKTDEYYIKPSFERHKHCYEERDITQEIHFEVLGASRQLYEEGNYLLWTTNTFSFKDAWTMRTFFDSLNLAQKRKLRKLHITTCITALETRMPLLTLSYPWERAVAQDLKHLKNLTTLHLRLQLEDTRLPNPAEQLSVCRNEITHSWDPEIVAEAQRWWLFYESLGLLSFRTLPLKEVTVVTSDDERWYSERQLSQFRWTAAEKNEFSDEYEAKLLDSDPAPIMQEEQKQDAERTRRVMEAVKRDSLRSHHERLRTESWSYVLGPLRFGGRGTRETWMED